MVLYSFYKYSAERTGGTYIFAGTATEAALSVYHRYAWRVLLSVLLAYHSYGAVGAVALAVVAGDTVLVGYAVVGNPHGCAYLYSALLLFGDWLYGTVGAHIGAGSAGCAAESALERHFGLHEAVDTIRGAQHIVGTF